MNSITQDMRYKQSLMEATDEEYDAEIRRLSDKYLMPPEQLKKFFKVREGFKLKQDIEISKAAEFIGRMVQQQSRDREAGKISSGAPAARRDK